MVIPRLSVRAHSHPNTSRARGTCRHRNCSVYTRSSQTTTLRPSRSSLRPRPNGEQSLVRAARTSSSTSTVCSFEAPSARLGGARFRWSAMSSALCQARAAIRTRCERPPVSSVAERPPRPRTGLRPRGHRALHPERLATDLRHLAAPGGRGAGSDRAGDETRRHPHGRARLRPHAHRRSRAPSRSSDRPN